VAKVKDVTQIRFISPEPVLAEILAVHKPILLSETGWKWIVSWIADVGVVMRSRDFIVFNLAYLASMIMMEGVMTVMNKFIGEKLQLFKRWFRR